MRKTLFFAALAAATGLALAQDTGKVYRFGDHEKHTIITFTSETEIETIQGHTNKCKGQTWLDFENLKGKCNIRVPVDSLRTLVDLRDEHLRSDTWLDAEKYPEIKLVSDGFNLVLKNKDKGIYQAQFAGKLTIKGVTKDLETAAKVIKLTPEQNETVGPGEWVHVVAIFNVTIKDFGINVPEGAVLAKVSPTWSVKFDCYASTETPAK